MKNLLNNRRFVTLGDLVADYYYKDGKLIAIDGGCSKFNCLVGLSHMGNSTAVISSCPTSVIGDMLVAGLKTHGVDTSNVLRFKSKPRIYHLVYEGNGNYTSSKICPFCGNTSWYPTPFTTISRCIKNLNPTDVIIFDNIKQYDMDLIRNTSNEKVIDIGRISTLNALHSKSLIIALCSRFEIIQCNETVEKYLLQRFNFTNTLQLFSFFQPKMLIVTRGKKGAEIIYNFTSFRKRPKNVVNCEFDTTGAGDAFFSVFINEYYSSSANIEDKIFSALEKASTVTTRVVNTLGARGYIYPPFGYIPKPGICTCEDLLSFA